MERVYRCRTHLVALFWTFLASVLWVFAASYGYALSPYRYDWPYYLVGLGMPALIVGIGFKNLGVYPSSLREIAVRGENVILRRRSGKEEVIEVTSVTENRIGRPWLTISGLIPEGKTVARRVRQVQFGEGELTKRDFEDFRETLQSQVGISEAAYRRVTPRVRGARLAFGSIIFFLGLCLFVLSMVAAVIAFSDYTPGQEVEEEVMGGAAAAILSYVLSIPFVLGFLFLLKWPKKLLWLFMGLPILVFAVLAIMASVA